MRPARPLACRGAEYCHSARASCPHETHSQSRGGAPDTKPMSYIAPRYCAVIRTVRLLPLVMGVWLLGMAVSLADAAEITGSDAAFRPYALQYVRPADVEATLAPLLPPGGEVIADAKGNRVLVRGPAGAHEVAQQVIRSLDKPPSAPPGVAAGSTGGPPSTTLRVYPCAVGQAQAEATRLQAALGGVPGVRIVPDERTAQILVVAPADVQAHVAALLAQSPRPGGVSSPASDAVSPAAATMPAGTQVEHRLAVMSADRLEAALLAILGARLQPVSLPGAEMGVYRVALADGRLLTVEIHRRANHLRVSGPEAESRAFLQMVRALDTPSDRGDETMRMVALRTTRPEDARRTVEALRASALARKGGAEEPLASKLFQSRPKAETRAAPQLAQAQPAPPPEGAPPPPKPEVPAQPGEEEGAGMIGPVQVEMLEGLDILIVRGHRRDVQRVLEIIQRIEELSQVTEPAIVVYQLGHVDSVALANLVIQVYSEVFAARQGAVSITALVKPNALLLIGRKESVERVIDLIRRLDVPVAPETQFQVFRLRHAAASTLQTTIQGLYTDRGGLGPVVRVTADVRSNALIVQASPRDMAEVATMIARLDVPESEKKVEIRIFRLNHAVADTLLPVLQAAIQAQAAAVPGAAPAAQAAQPAGQATNMLEFLTVDVQGQRRLSSGILVDVRIAADTRANALIVTAPAESMPLIEALIKQLDQPPAVRAEIKVFTIVNGDAQALTAMLMDLFAQTAVPGQAAPVSAAGEGETSLIPVRFVADPRTNSIIAAGSRSDLLVAEAILLRLDESAVTKRKTTVYRLKNTPATDVANAVNNFLQTERSVERIAAVSPFEQIEREVVAVPEPITNSLIISATPRYYDEVMRLVEQLDQRPPMVMIQVLIAEVTLNDTDEFGVQLGLQDQILFDRSPTAGTPAVPTPGFNFNNQPLGGAAVRPDLVASQGLADFALSRTNPTLGFGGLVLSASSESVSILLRALQERRRLEVLSRPQIMTLDNQAAYIQVGQRVPQIRGVSLTQFGQTNNIDYEDVGLILQVIPRISPDGLVVMEIDANRSSVGPEAEGIPVSITTGGGVIRAPRINRTLAQTTVQALSGQTVILGGLISREKSEAHRQVPLLGDIPVLGRLFRFDSTTNQRTELLIIMTPHIIKNEEDAERIKRAEIARMHWCLADVIEVHGDGGLRGRADQWTDSETITIYPDLAPSAETIPAPKPEPANGSSTPKQPTLAPKPAPNRGANGGAAAGPRGSAPTGTEGARPAPGNPGQLDSGYGPVLQPSPAAGAAVYQEAAPANPADAESSAEYDLRPTAHTTVRYGPPPPRWAPPATNPLRPSR